VGDREVTILNQKAVRAYLYAKEEMPNTKVEDIAYLADRMAGAAFDKAVMPSYLKRMSQDAMMAIESTIFVEICNANGIDWRNLCA
jgi:hypothetical protein